MTNFFRPQRDGVSACPDTRLYFCMIEVRNMKTSVLARSSPGQLLGPVEKRMSDDGLYQYENVCHTIIKISSMKAYQLHLC